MYYINDGVYGSFNTFPIDPKPVLPTPLYPLEKDAPLFESSIWGPTLDSVDRILRSVLLPEIDVGSWLIFKDMGAYSTSLSTNFNSMPHPSIKYICQEAYRSVHWMNI